MELLSTSVKVHRHFITQPVSYAQKLSYECQRRSHKTGPGQEMHARDRAKTRYTSVDD